VRIDAAACLPTRTDDPVAALLLPLTAEIVGALHHADLDPGWNAVVAGDGVRAELLLQLAPVTGARQVLAVRDADARASTEPCLRGAPAHVRQELAERLAALGGRVLAFDTTGDPAWQQTLLAALPAESTLLLLGRAATPGAGARVNIYRDVHRKNVRIESAPVLPDRRAVTGAERLLARRRIDTRRLDVPVQAVGPGQTPHAGGRWAILRWSDS
jgi:threonine dehydrogenase-like Zn-dependent dehydrogenase